MMNRMALIMVCLVLVFSMVSCDDQDRAVGYGSLSVEVSDGVNSKTIRPADESLAFASYRIEGRHRTIEGRSVDETFTGGSIEIDQLETGEWEFMVEGLNKDGIVLAKSDVHIVTIKTNGTAKETYTLDWIEGHGTLQLSVKVQTSRVSTIECLLYDEDCSEAGTYVMTKDDSRQDGEGFLVFEHSFSNVPTGSYDSTMTMKDKDGGEIGRALHPSVHIHDSLVSSYGFSWENFKNLLPNVDAPSVTNIGESATTISCYSTILLGTEEDGTTIFYSLDGKSYSKYQEGAIDLSAMGNLNDSITIWAYAEKASLNKSDVAEYTFNIEHNSPDRANAEYTWNAVEDGYECIATSKCLYHKGNKCKPEKAVVSCQILVESTHEEEGKGLYTAEFENEELATQMKEGVVPRGHIYDCEVVDTKYLKTTATCLEPAIYYKSCACGKASNEKYFSSGNPLGHDLVLHEAKLATCTEVGWDTYDTCLRCNYTTYKYIPTIEHTYVKHSAKNPTCTENGWDEYFTCAICDYTTYNEIPARHELLYHDAKIPTCTETGWDAYYTCFWCNYTSKTEISALGHNLEHHEANNPRCTEIGWDEYDTCTRCDYTTFKAIGVLGHQFVNLVCTLCNSRQKGPAGGYMFYDCDADNDSSINDGRGEDNLMSSECGWRYLEAAPDDLRLVKGVPTVDSTMDGYSDGTQRFIFGYYRETSDGSTIRLSTKTGIGEGVSNTDILVGKMQDVAYAYYSGTDTTQSYAARLCDILEYEVDGKVFNDWFLPSQDELNLMCENLYKNGLGSFASNHYWSSSERDASSAWKQYFSAGDQYSDNRFNESRVRPVRAF